MGEKIFARKLHAHGPPNVLFEFDDSHAVQFPRRMLDLSGDQPTILRPGGVSREQIESIIGAVKVLDRRISPEEPATSPGQFSLHYAPRTPAYRFETSENFPTSVISCPEIATAPFGIGGPSIVTTTDARMIIR